nr:uncharacterized protein LOC129386264 [Dermacentor andersoni]
MQVSSLSAAVQEGFPAHQPQPLEYDHTYCLPETSYPSEGSQHGQHHTDQDYCTLDFLVPGPCDFHPPESPGSLSEQELQGTSLVLPQPSTLLLEPVPSMSRGVLQQQAVAREPVPSTSRGVLQQQAVARGAFRAGARLTAEILARVLASDVFLFCPNRACPKHVSWGPPAASCRERCVQSWCTANGRNSCPCSCV